MTNTKRLVLAALAVAAFVFVLRAARTYPALDLRGHESLFAVEQCFKSALRPFLRRAVAMIVQLRRQVAATRTQASLWPRQNWPGRQAAI
ncbi:MAG: hypothetical protein KGL04_05640 [Elusimicrobia bacterium]|nr:hypothetical protein [Elusimicrobiota bacterium]MDE2313636.1 hypothetical protein [Elusimicrobiota bacterium]